MDGIYAGATVSAKDSCYVAEGGETAQTFTKGQTIKGIITAVSDNILINFSGKELSFSKEVVQNAREGDIRTYEIMEASSARLVLKEVKGMAAGSEHSGILFTTVEAGQTVLESCTDNQKDTSDDEENLDSISNRMTGKDYSELSSEGMSIEKYNLERLSRALERIKLQKQLKAEGIDNQKENLQQDKEAVDSMAVQSMLTGPYAERIAEQLSNADLPVTEENIARISNAVNLASCAQNLTDSSFSYLIGNQLTPTIENCYKASHAGTGKTVPVSDKLWNELTPAVNKVTEETGLDINEETNNSARWLMENNLPLTASNLASEEVLRQIPETYDEQNVLELAVDELSNKKQPEQADLSQLVTRRRREETRVELMSDSAAAAKKLGVEEGIEDAVKGVEQLKEKENAYYRSLAEEADGTAGEEQINLVRETLESVKIVKEAPEQLYSATWENRKSENLRTLAEAAQSPEVQKSESTAAQKNAAAAYENSETQVRTDLGDSIKKAFSGIDSILENMQLEVNESNRRAVRMLGYNSIEITQENIQEMKTYNLSVSTALDRLQPSVVTELIQQGVNPLNLPINELNEAAGRIIEAGSDSAGLKYSEYLAQLDEKDGLSEKERETYIGIYRLLNSVEKTDGAAIGALVQSGREITLGNLLSSVRTIRSGGIEKTVDDTTGMLSQVQYKNKTITDQISEALPDSGTEYNRMLLENLMKNLTPQALDLAVETDTWQQMSIETLSDAAAESIPSEANAESTDVNREERSSEKLETIRKLASESANELAFLNDYGIESTIETITAAHDLLEGGGWFRRLKDNGGDTDVYTEPDTIITGAEELDDTLKSQEIQAEMQIEELYSDNTITAARAEGLAEIEAGISLSRALRRRGCYTIPYDNGNGITTINLTVRSGTEKGGIDISIPESEAGRLNIHASVNEDSADIYITGDSRKGLDTLQEAEDTLKEALENLQINNAVVNYGLRSAADTTYIYVNGGIYKNTDNYQVTEKTEGGTEAADTEKLYSIAKQIICFAQRAFTGGEQNEN